MLSVILNYISVIHTINWGTFKFSFCSGPLSLAHHAKILLLYWFTIVDVFTLHNESHVWKYSFRYIGSQGTYLGKAYGTKWCAFGNMLWKHIEKLGEQEESNCALDLCFPSSICTERKWKRVTRSNVFYSCASHVLDACDLPLLLQQKGEGGGILINAVTLFFFCNLLKEKKGGKKDMCITPLMYITLSLHTMKRRRARKM